MKSIGVLCTSCNNTISLLKAIRDDELECPQCKHLMFKYIESKCKNDNNEKVREKWKT